MPKNQGQIKVIDLLKSFEFDYFAERGKTSEVLDTWDREYRRVYSHLPLDDLLTEDALKQVILRTEANTRHRRRYVLACVKLADYAELGHDLKRFIGNYSLKSVNPRKVPSDDAIAQTWEQIKSPEWRWVYGMMATYGIRNCEVFRLDLSKFPVVYVDSVKKGRARLVYPLYPEWVEQFYLASVRLPECTGRNNSEFGVASLRDDI